MEVGDRSADGPGVAVEMRPAGDQLGYRRHGDHGSVLLLVWATSLDRRAAAECSRGGDPWAPGPYSTGNNPGARGVSIRLADRAPRGPVGAARARPTRS